MQAAQPITRGLACMKLLSFEVFNIFDERKLRSYESLLAIAGFLRGKSTGGSICLPWYLQAC
ncbi:uncharacterized protein SETTUDRAFT_164239 [Exserohilum turcica Et28A]|uniref:Uncharacterized protein n=1 Tax=Exserohilum turcicum (strain 28A) TaxID=671987 RepID=R0IEU8_EXST2|nr:uncharacterized protein SETTUDRAFT_164239 [Exserohilum turcica Et28A]EOA83825.1 hypothetical protein SETTUDRAFT_164239 [Exserohilum turcica Et28A]